MSYCITCQSKFNPCHVGVLNSKLCRPCYIMALRDDKCGVTQRKLCGSSTCRECYMKSVAGHESCAYWDYIKNPVAPHKLLQNSNLNQHYICQVCEYTFEAAPYNVIKKKKICSHCSGKALCSKNDCMKCIVRTIASLEFAPFWSTKNEKTPRETELGSGIVVFFDCPDCFHEFDIIPNKMKQRDSWCPYCAVPTQRLCQNRECKHCAPRRFSSHPRSSLWSPKNKCSPYDIALNTHEKYLFDCDVCNHEFDAEPHNIVSGYNCCYYCTGKALCNRVECSTCDPRRFSTHPNSVYICDNKIPARMLARCSHVKYWFNCNTCNNKFKMGLMYVSRGQWCQKCVKKTEKKFADWCAAQGLDVHYQPSFDWCKKIRQLPFDFRIGNYIIEIDGDQHFRDIRGWNSEADVVRANDVYKMCCAFDNGFDVIRIYQPDLLGDFVNWQEQILEQIKKPIKEFTNMVAIAKNKSIYDQHASDIITFEYDD